MLPSLRWVTMQVWAVWWTVAELVKAVNVEKSNIATTARRFSLTVIRTQPLQQESRKQSERHSAVWSEGGCRRGFHGKAQALQQVARLHDFQYSGELRRCILRIAGEAVWQLHSGWHAGQRRSDHQ